MQAHGDIDNSIATEGREGMQLMYTAKIKCSLEIVYLIPSWNFEKQGSEAIEGH